LKKLDAKKYIVLEKKGVSGLTVAHKSLKPGFLFSENDWIYGEEALDNAIDKKRCKLVSKPDKKAEKAEKAEKKADKADKSKVKKQEDGESK
jgi:choline kinase